MLTELEAVTIAPSHRAVVANADVLEEIGIRPSDKLTSGSPSGKVHFTLYPIGESQPEAAAISCLDFNDSYTNHVQILTSVCSIHAEAPGLRSTADPGRTSDEGLSARSPANTSMPPLTQESARNLVAFLP